MTAQVEARGLSGIHRGKHVTLTVPGREGIKPWQLEGELVSTTHWGDGTVSLTVKKKTGPALDFGIYLPPETLVEITREGEPMSGIEARRLSGLDIGKSMRTKEYPAATEIIEVEHDTKGCWVMTTGPDGRRWNTRLGPLETVEITGKKS